MVTIDQARAAALALPGAEEQETWHRPTFRVGEHLFAALHDELLILRATPKDQTHLLQTDTRFSTAPYWGRSGWVAIKLTDVTPEELPALLDHAHALIDSAG
jgi:predicted DNA-binding protein (MmcQ/YjbR family)